MTNHAANQFYEANLRALRSRWPSLASSLREAGDISAVWDANGPVGALVVDGQHLSSLFDPRSEAELQASLIPEDSSRAWVYGVAGGELPRRLLRRTALKRLTVVILNPALWHTSLRYYRHDDWLLDPRVELELANERSRPHTPFAASPPCLQLAADPAAALRDRLQLELNTHLINRRFEQQQEQLGHIEANLPALERDGDVSELFGTHPRGTISVVAAGPTLDFHYGFLANPQPIITVDRALKLLVQRGISPRYVISIDPHETVTDYLDIPEEQARQITLIYMPTISPQAVERWAGPRLAAYGEGQLFDTVAKSIPKTKLFRSGSVIHPAVDLVTRMGAHRVLLFGADFCFPYGKCHANGSQIAASAAEQGSTWVHDWDGRRVATLDNLRGYLRDLEDYIAHHTDVRFYSFGERGARLAGSQLIRDLR